MDFLTEISKRSKVSIGDICRVLEAVNDVSQKQKKEMTDEITKKELGAAVAEEFNLSPAIGSQIVEFLGDEIRAAVAAGRRVELRNFLTVERELVPERKGRVPLRDGSGFQEWHSPEHYKAHVRASDNFFDLE